MKRNGKVLHITESFGGGVGAAIIDYVDSSPEVEHHLVYAERADAPIPESHLSHFKTATAMPAGHAQRVRAIRKHARTGSYDVIHAHSSFAGAYTRLALRKSKHFIVYTPHCYASERRDISPIKRNAFAAVERTLAINTSVFAACSVREAELSQWTKRSITAFVPNIPPRLEEAAARPKVGGKLKIVGAGRAAPQKDPSFFIDAIRLLRDQGIALEATWIGGDDELRERAAIDGIEVTGWLERPDALARLSAADLYLHTAAWEGFPVAVLESLALNVPTVVRAIPAFDGVDIPFITAPSELAEKLGTISTETLEEILTQGKRAVTVNTRSNQRAALLEIYSQSPSFPPLPTADNPD